MYETDYLEDHEELLKKLDKLPFLESMDSKHLVNMLTLSKLRTYKAGETIVSEGIYDSYLYIVVYGEVKIIKDGNEITRLNEPGDTFGELAIIDGNTRSATVIASITTLCLASDVSFIDQMPAEEKHKCYSVFYRLIAEILTQRLRETNREVSSLKEEIFELKKSA
jgi:CRP/FNR family cyclic AMP-dependent transcriptional regulator